MRKEKGITLIALIITIVIMIILASISVSIVINEKIIKKADDAAELTRTAQEREIREGRGFNIKGNTYETLQDYVDLIKPAESIENIMEDALLDRNGMEAIGIGPNGEKVNMAYWRYNYWMDNYYDNYGVYHRNVKQAALEGYLDDFDDYGVPHEIEPAYIGPIVDGKIVGAVPQYIAPEGEEQFYEVFYLNATFVGIDDLVVAPELPTNILGMQMAFEFCTSLTTVPTIPNSVISLYNTFNGCTSLTTAPEIPQNITGLISTFYNCTSLTTAPEIPNSVTDLQSTFSGCTSLTTAPEIPQSVRGMGYTFCNCSKLTGTLTINTVNLYNWESCLEGAATDPDSELHLNGTSPYLNNIYETKSENSHVIYDE